MAQFVGIRRISPFRSQHLVGHFLLRVGKWVEKVGEEAGGLMNTELRQVREMSLILWRGHTTRGMMEGRNGETGSEEGRVDIYGWKEF